MSTIKSSAENLTLNADGANNDIIFQSNGSNVATLDQAGLLTATTFAGSGASLTALNATNLGSGTVPTARLGTGTADSSVHLRGDGTWAAAGGGKVLQVVGAATNSGSSTATSSTSFVTTGISGTITPSATSSKILVIISTAGSSEAAGRALYWTVYRGSTNLGNAANGFGHLFNDNDRVRASIHMNFLDSPSTTSAVTYTIYFRSNISSNVELPADAQMEHITLMEIGA